MSSFEENNVAINLKLFKILRIFDLFDPNSPKIFNYNVFRLATALIAVIVLCIVVYGSFGFIVGSELKNMTDPLITIQVIGIYMVVVQAIFKIAIITYNADTLWELLHLSRINFLESKKCSYNLSEVFNCRKKSILFSTCFAILGVAITIMWMIFPLVTNAYMIIMIKSDSYVLRYENTLNFFFPLTISYYNKYYFVFYTMENIVNLFYAYVIISTNIILLSLFLVVTYQYEVLFMSYENFGYKNELQNEVNLKPKDIIAIAEDKNYTSQSYDNFISILDDQRRLFIKLQSLYNILQPIVLITVIITSGLILVMCVPIAKVLITGFSQGAYMLIVIKLCFSFSFFWIELYTYCYLLDDINNKKESLSFGMYCCNWTDMNLRFRKLLLLSMQMNDTTNNLKIKATPLRVVNLMLFSKVASTTYNVVSVMLNTLL